MGNWARGEIVALRLELRQMITQVQQAAKINAKEGGPLLVQFLLGDNHARLERVDAAIGRLLNYRGDGQG